jgi:hypothetical protein
MRPQPGITKRAEVPVGEHLEAEFLSGKPLYRKEDCDVDGNPLEGSHPYKFDFGFRLTDPRYEDAIGEWAHGQPWVNQKPARQYTAFCKAIGVPDDQLEDWDSDDYRGAPVVILCKHREGKGRDGESRLYTDVTEVTARG